MFPSVKVLGFLLAIAALTLVACSGTASPNIDAGNQNSSNGSPSANSQEERVLRIATTFLDEPPDPFKAGWLAVPTGLSETLYRLDRNLKPQPWLAAGAVQVEPTTWEIILRDDVKFHNGVVMDAEKVKGSLDLAVERSPGTRILLDISRVEIKDPLTITIVTNSPNPTFLGLLSNQNTGIADPATVPASADETASGAATTGPYKLVSFSADQSMTVEAHPDYWGGTPALNRVEYVAFTEANSRLIAVQSGDVDIAVNLSPQGAQLVENDPNLEVKSAPPSSMQFMFVNHQSPNMQDLRVRQALAMAIDRASIVNSVAQGTAEVAGNMFPHGFLSCGNVNDYAYDPEAARSLLLEADYQDSNGDGIVEKEGKPLKLILQTYPQQPLLPPMMETVQGLLKDIGIDSKLEIVEFHFASQGGYDLFGYSNSTVNTGDPQWALTRQFLTNGDENRGHYSNSNVDGLIAQLTQASDASQREQEACNALQAGHDDVALIPVMHPNRLFGVSNKVDWPEGPHPMQIYFVDHRIGLK